MTTLNRASYSSTVEVPVDLLGAPWVGEVGGELASHYYRARYYDSKLGRFLSEDPIGLVAGTNLLAYVGGKPTRHGDPTGLVTGEGVIVIIIVIYTLHCVTTIQRIVKAWRNPHQSGYRDGGSQIDPPDDKARVQHCIAECLIARTCPGGRPTAQAAGTVQEMIGATTGEGWDPKDQEAGKRGRDMSIKCPSGDCFEMCLAAHRKGSNY